MKEKGTIYSLNVIEQLIFIFKFLGPSLRLYNLKCKQHGCRWTTLRFHWLAVWFIPKREMHKINFPSWWLYEFKANPLWPWCFDCWWQTPILTGKVSFWTWHRRVWQRQLYPKMPSRSSAHVLAALWSSRGNDISTVHVLNR